MTVIHQKISSPRSAPTGEEIELRDIKIKESDSSSLASQKTPAKGSIYLWIGLGVFVVMTSLVVLVLIILVAIPA